MFDKEAYKEWYDEWKEKYHNKRFIDFSKYITEKEKQTLKKLNIEIEDKIYTEYEFNRVELDLYSYHGERKKRESLGVSYREIKRLWDLVNQMSSDYDL